MFNKSNARDSDKSNARDFHIIRHFSHHAHQNAADTADPPPLPRGNQYATNHDSTCNDPPSSIPARGGGGKCKTGRCTVER